MTDKRNQIRDALRAAGVLERALDAAEAIFKPRLTGADPNAPLAWELEGANTSLAKHARRFAEKHDYMRGMNPKPSEKGLPTYRDGTPIPFDELSAEELLDLQAAEDAPAPPPAHVPAVAADEARAAVHADALEAAKQAKKKRDTFTPGDGHRGVAPPSPVTGGSVYTTTAEEDFDAAGDGRDLEGYWGGGDGKDRA